MKPVLTDAAAGLYFKYKLRGKRSGDLRLHGTLLTQILEHEYVQEDMAEAFMFEEAHLDGQVFDVDVGETHLALTVSIAPISAYNWSAEDDEEYVANCTEATSRLNEHAAHLAELIQEILRPALDDWAETAMPGGSEMIGDAEWRLATYHEVHTANHKGLGRLATSYGLIGWCAEVERVGKENGDLAYYDDSIFSSILSINEDSIPPGQVDFNPDIHRPPVSCCCQAENVFDRPYSPESIEALLARFPAALVPRGEDATRHLFDFEDGVRLCCYRPDDADDILVVASECAVSSEVSMASPYSREAWEMIVCEHLFQIQSFERPLVPDSYVAGVGGVVLFFRSPSRCSSSANQ